MTGPRVATIPAGRSFVDALAAGLLAEAGGEPERLAGTTVLLPTRRACTALAEAFLRVAGGRPLLLPRMFPIGDVDSDELVLSAEDETWLDALVELPPAIAPLERQMLLTRLVLQKAEAEGGGIAGVDQAARLAAELARLIDQVQIERLDFGRLADLVPEDYSAHWQVTLEFLKIVTDAWPAVLAERGLIDPAERRNRLLEAQAEAWRRRAPAGPVIAAGSTGSVPATADLLTVVAGLPAGLVILPGLDPFLDAETRGALEPGHPQWGMARLLDRLGVAPEAVPVWPAEPATADARARLISELMRPSSTTERWRDLDRAAVGAGAAGITRVDCDGIEEEARVCALVLREALEHPGATAALVTPDRGLARRVKVELGRFGVGIDDSAGEALADTPPAVFLRLVARLAVESLAPVPLLACLKHPLAAAGAAPAVTRALARRLELAALRGPRPAPGFAGLRAVLVDTKRPDLDRWLDRLEERLAPLLDLAGSERVPLARLIEAHVEAAERMAESDVASGAERLWAGEAGEAAARFVEELAAAADLLPPIRPRDYLGLIEDLMRGRVVRPRWRGHPRLAILGALEARLQSFDRLVLGGLNEGVWPPEPAADPWMSRPMRERFGLPSPERRIGLAAHDFAQAFCAPRLFLTRSRMVERAPTVPSRWLARLDAVLKAAGGDLDEVDALAWRGRAAGLDAPGRPVRIEPPAPRPPFAARPRRLSVTQVETWLRDPYAIYARHILRLRSLDPIDADPGAADRGTAMHAALDSFVREHPEELPPDALDRLLALGREAFAGMMDRPGVRAFWWPRFERIAAWFVDLEAERRPTLARSLTEQTGRLLLEAPGGPFELTGKADRIDVLREGGMVLVDYKTGGVPSGTEVREGVAVQLPLEAAIALARGFAGVGAEVARLEYWHLAGGDEGGRVVDPLVARNRAVTTPADVAATAREGLEAWIAAFDDEATPYLATPRPDLQARWSDYDHLARRDEWSDA